VVNGSRRDDKSKSQEEQAKRMKKANRAQRDDDLPEGLQPRKAAARNTIKAVRSKEANAGNRSPKSGQ